MRQYTKKQVENPSERKGREFETYVKDLFPPKELTIVRWTTDIVGKHDGTFVESDMDPDFLIRDEKTKEKFAIECKYRSNFIIKDEGTNKEEHVIDWSNDKQVERYKNYEKENKTPVIIVIGIGGTPSNPDFMFAIPLREIKYPKIYERIFCKFERLPDKPFFWYNKTLL